MLLVAPGCLGDCDSFLQNSLVKRSACRKGWSSRRVVYQTGAPGIQSESNHRNGFIESVIFMSVIVYISTRKAVCFRCCGDGDSCGDGEVLMVVVMVMVVKSLRY